MHIEYAPKLSRKFSGKELKVVPHDKLQQEFPFLKKRYWGNQFLGQVGMWSME